MRALLLGLLLSAPPALASHESGCVPDAYTGEWAELFLDTRSLHETHGAAPHWYVFYESHVFMWPTATTWIYQESNGLPGLQRGGSDYYTSESCGHGADRIIF